MARGEAAGGKACDQHEGRHHDNVGCTLGTSRIHYYRIVMPSPFLVPSSLIGRRQGPSATLHPTSLFLRGPASASGTRSAPTISDSSTEFPLSFLPS
ncbi:hypothetical protein N7510_006077 [Penicillium lagena]|uniref:uncharacterized protein n=1 Tax=Penicillium lagena TaxID=94218 RepID=UPI002541FD0B|nr:uncharacterized protein N7510_006077 [Penicillium lagena]KAJ5612883.1 hypothetical protein N7510_006077 [Penicillium lagena]